MVYLALDPEIDTRVALKLIRLDEAPDLVASERRGAQLQRDVHRLVPAVAGIREIGEADGYLYIAMEHISGPSLARVLAEEGALKEDLAVDVALQLAKLLREFHGAGGEIADFQGPLIHGDIKPQNIHLQGMARIRLLDFGLAQRVVEDRPAPVSDFGSIPYISPERSRHGTLTPAADLWSTGVVLYQMLSGRLPFPGDTETAIRRRIEEGDGPEPLPETVSPAVRKVVLRCLDPDPERRYRSAGDLHRALAAAAKRPAREVGKTRRTKPSQATVRTGRGHREHTPPPPLQTPAFTAPTNSKTPADGASTSTLLPKPRRRLRWLRPAAIVAAVLVVLLALALAEVHAVTTAAEIERQADAGGDVGELSQRYLEVRRWDLLGLTEPVGRLLQDEIHDRTMATIQARREGTSVNVAAWQTAVHRLDLARRIEGNDDREHAKQLYCRGQIERQTALRALGDRNRVKAVQHRDAARERFREASRISLSWPVPAVAVVELELLPNLGEKPDLDVLERSLRIATARSDRFTPEERRHLISGYEELGTRAEISARSASDLPEWEWLFLARQHFEHAQEQCRSLVALADRAPPCRERLRGHLDRVNRRLSALGFAV